MKTNFSKEQLEAALAVVNEQYGGNVRLVHGTVATIGRSADSRWRRFTLRVKSSRGPGAKISMTSFKDRRSVAACWHVHGDFFDALWNNAIWAAPDGATRVPYYIEAGKVGRMRGPLDNWQDYGIGSAYRPVMFSRSCACSHIKPTVKMIRQADLTADCWLVQAWGLEACLACEVKGTDDCGGRTILEKISRGIFPEDGLPSSQKA